MDSLLTLIELLKPVWHLFDPSDVDVVVESTVMGLHEEAVASGFDDFDDLRKALGVWAREQLPTLVERLVAGERLTVEEIQESLQTAVLDPFPDSRGEDAAEAFVLALKRRLYRSDDGNLIIGQQVDATRVELASGFDAVNQALSSGFESIQQTLGVYATSEADSADGDPAAQDPARVRIEARLSDARQLLIAGKPATALEQLQRIENEEAASLWTRAQFRISLNSSVAMMQLGEVGSAEKRLSRAAVLYPEDPILRSNQIQLLLMKGETDEALGLARQEIDSGVRGDVRASVMHALSSAGCADEAVALAPDDESIDAGELVALADAHLRLGNYQQAITAADKAAALDPDDAVVRQMCGTTRLLEARRRSHSAEVPADGGPSIGDLLKDAKRELHEAVRIATAGELSNLLTDIRVNLAAAELASGNFSEAVALGDLVLGARPSDNVARLNRGAALFRLHQHERAASDLQEALEEHPRESIIALAVSLTELGRFSEALDALQTVWELDIDDELRVDLADLVLQVPESSDHVELVADAEKYLLESADHKMAAVTALARRAARRRETDEAKGLLDAVDVEQALRAGATTLTVMDAAVIYYGLGDYGSAARLSGLVVNDERLPDASELLVLSLYRAGRFTEAFETAADYREKHGVRPTIAQIEASLDMQLGDMTAAARLYREMYDGDGDIRWALNAGSCWLSQGDVEAARTALDGLDLLGAELPPEAQIQAAGILLRLGSTSALELAYRAARRAPNDADIQAAYLGIFLESSRAGEHAFDVSEAHPGTAALVTIDGQRNWRLIVDCDETSINPLDVDPQDDLGAALVGHKSGDTVVLGSGEQTVVIQIEEVQSKYVRLFQEVFTGFGTRFPTNRSIRALHASENDLSELHAELGRQHRAMVEAMDLVNDKGIPAAAFSRLTGVGIFESTHALLVDPKVTSRMSDPTLLAADKVSADTVLVLDLSALVTLQSLGLLSPLSTTGVRSAVASQTLDELRAAEARLRERKEADTLAGDGQRIVLTTADQHQGLDSVLVVLGEIGDFAQRHCETGTSTALLEHLADPDTLSMMLGTPSLASALYANDLKATLVSDEAGMRVLVSMELGVRTTDTLALVRMMAEAGVISEEAVRESVGRLLDKGYSALPLSAEEVLDLVRKRHFNPDSATIKVVRGAMTKALLTPDEVVTLAAEILTIVCFDEPLGLAGGNLVDAVFEGLRERTDDVLTRVMALTKRKLVLAPLQWRRLGEYLTTSFSAHGLQPPQLP